MPNFIGQGARSAIAFIDRQVEDYQGLIAGVKPGTEVVVLDGDRDAIDQITQVLGDRNNIDSIHIISHGSSGCLQLGNGSLSAKNIETYGDRLQQWFALLLRSRETFRGLKFIGLTEILFSESWTDTISYPQSRISNPPEIILYGCNVAADATGLAFIKRLSELTGASVAASKKLTGSAAKGGDWELEVRTGKIEKSLVFEPKVLAAYEYVLNSFGAATNFGAGSYPVFVDVADFNGDKIKDLAVTNANAPINGSNPGTSILLGTSAGSFGTATQLGKGRNVFAIANFDGNIYEDLVADNGSGSVSIFLGNSSGLGAPVNLSFDPLIFAKYIVAADFNGDKRADIAVATNRVTGSLNTNGVISILLQNLDGTFSAPVNSLVGRTPAFITVGDFDGDRKQDDLAVTSPTDNTVSILLADDNGVFSNGPTIPVGTQPNSIAIGRFDADYTDDLAVANVTSKNVSILLQKTTGTFTAAPNLAVDTNFLAAGDIDVDGTSDLAVTKGTPRAVSVLMGKGNGEFSTPIDFPVGSANSYLSVVVKDIDGDKKPDIAATSFDDNNVSVLLNTPNTVNFGAATYSGTEGSADTVIPVTLSGGTPLNDVTVPIVIDPSSTATENSDYTFSPTTVTFPIGTTTLTQNVAVTIKPDNLPENAETAILNFGAITGGVAGTTKQTTLTIAANGTVSYAIAAGTASIPEGNSGTKPLAFTATRSGNTGGASSVNYAIGGTATNVSDYNNIGGTSGATTTNGTINFAADETSKTITLDVLGDTQGEPDETVTVTLLNPTGPGVTPTITTSTATTTITNDDKAGFTINPTALTTSEVGGTATFTVKLNSQPTADVTIDLSSSNVAEGTVSTNSLTFTPAKYNEPQTITVSGVDDLLADGPQPYKIVTAAARSTDLNYNNVNPDDVAVTNSDDETPGITVNPTAGLITGEDGTKANFTVVLNTQPTADVTIELNTDNVAEGTVSTNRLTFTPAKWNTAQEVTVTGVEDNSIADGDIDYKIVTEPAVSTDASYNLDVADLSITNKDNDTASISITPTATTAIEGGAAGSYDIKLTSQPIAPVTINFTASEINAIEPVTFDSTNWNVATTVTVTATDDSKTEGTHTGTIAHTVTSTDPKYSGTAVQDVKVEIADNDAAGVTIAPTSTTAIEGGATGSYTVKLNSLPSAPVRLSFNTGSQINPVSAINFNSTNWNIPETVTVTATDDRQAEGQYAHSGTIAHILTSTDPNYSGTAVQDVKVDILDNDAAGVTIAPTSITATEGVANGNYDIKLTSQPSFPVTINFTTDQQIEAIAPVTFTADNWNVPQSVTVKAVDDTIVEGAHNAKITHDVSSSDTNYNSRSGPDVTVAIADNDTGPLLGIPTVNFSEATYQVNESGQKQITLTRTGTAEALNKISQVYIQPVTGGSATERTDWKFASSDSGQVTVTFNPGKDIQTFTIEILPDTQGEGTEEIAFQIASADDANIGPQSSTTLQIFDGDRLFTDTNAPISGLSSAIWGDYNNDGKLDILGNSQIYDNIGTYDNNGQLNEYGFSEIYGRGLPGQNSVWADYNNDGRLDTSLTNTNSDNTLRYGIYSSDTKFNFDANPDPDTGLRDLLPSRIFSSSSADYNNDGRPDLLLNTVGSYPEYPITTTLYRNTKPIMYQDRFQDSKARLDTGEPLFSTSEIAGANSPGVWADYDNDGKLDILIRVTESQQTQSGQLRRKAKLYRNLGDGVFKETAVSLPGLGSEFPRFGATVDDMAWGDYDNDGKLDILLTGAMDDANGSTQLFTKVYRNTTSTNGSASFEDIGVQIPGLSQAKAAWGDYDNDGKLDILLTGWDRQDFASPGTSVTKVYRNTGNGFTDSGAQIDSGAQPGATTSSTTAWGDFDKDGKLDILLTGGSSYSDSFTKVFRNNTPNANTRPDSPTGLTAKSDGGTVTFKWDKATDDHTPADGLSYNLQVKTSDGKDIILSSMSLWDGTRQIVGLGNVSQNTQWQLKDLPHGTYSWGVQAIDNAWAGSPFAFGESFTIENSPPEEQINLGAKATEFNRPIKDVYTDPDGDLINYQLTLPNGSPLYSDSNTSWLGLQYDYWQNTITFTGTPPSGSQPFKVKLIATDDLGRYSEQTFTVTTKDGRWVIDGYISGATVFLDANKNAILDTSEPSTITDTGGKFNLDIPFETFDTNKNGEIDPEEGNLVAVGGTDTATGLPLETPVTAPADSSVVTLLTTLVADLIDKGIAPEAAQSLVKAALGLPADVDLTSFDPIEATNNNIPGGVQVLAAMVKVQNFITQTAALIDGASIAASQDLVKAVVRSINEQIQSGTVLNLSNAAALEPIIQQAAAKIQQIDPSFNSQKLSQMGSQAATVMATANQRIDSAVSNPTATSIPEAVARVQQVALGLTTQDFKAVGAETKPISQVVADNTGAALDSKIQAVTLPVGIATPVVSGDADLGSNSPNRIVGTNGDDTLTGDSENNALMGMRGNDYLDGGIGNDSIFGGKGGDALLGSSGDDVLFGNRGADFLNGGDGNDILYAGKSDDLLNGGLGNDSLIGGNGSDRFLLSTNSGIDTIFDFEDGQDLLSLGNNLTFAQLLITQENSSTLIRLSATGEILASLNGVSASLINAADFNLA
ncbi:DUF4347 domain-containing protein [Kamptonema animale CS-326]|jgi:hypothetical protein|uniref:DUF4347 domain-containing protein n=1 Tax=Kamptonema animale TaxID=92934 RepID=UPI002330431A|nr:DUF4347 domain-containing protein [Kamptonema animale]MDB9511190.1 DUF4347 domain-containing protein [Kamptonema animale CS-326]